MIILKEFNNQAGRLHKGLNRAQQQGLLKQSITTITDLTQEKKEGRILNPMLVLWTAIMDKVLPRHTTPSRAVWNTNIKIKETALTSLYQLWRLIPQLVSVVQQWQHRERAQILRNSPMEPALIQQQQWQLRAQRGNSASLQAMFSRIQMDSTNICLLRDRINECQVQCWRINNRSASILIKITLMRSCFTYTWIFWIRTFN